MDCSAFCAARSYNLKPLFAFLRLQCKTTLHRDVIHAEIPCEEGIADIFCFSYGAIVCWGLSKEKGELFLKKIKEFEEQSFEEIEIDEFTYLYGDIQKIKDDEIILPNQDIFTKLAISHGLAQSVKLGTFEMLLQKLFDDTKYIPEDLAKNGKISLSRREIRCKMGKLFLERSSINVHVNVLDTPEFFWNSPEFEPLYHMIIKYMDLENRCIVLNQRLDVIRELFEMLGNELNQQHSSRLEWIIIILIVIEVVVSLLNDVLKVL